MQDTQSSRHNRRTFCNPIYVRTYGYPGNDLLKINLVPIYRHCLDEEESVEHLFEIVYLPKTQIKDPYHTMLLEFESFALQTFNQQLKKTKYTSFHFIWLHKEYNQIKLTSNETIIFNAQQYQQ